MIVASDDICGALRCLGKAEDLIESGDAEDDGRMRRQQYLRVVHGRQRLKDGFDGSRVDPILWLFDQKHSRDSVGQISHKRESQQTKCPVRCRPRRNLQTILKLQYQVPMAVFWSLDAIYGLQFWEGRPNVVNPISEPCRVSGCKSVNYRRKC